ncbi:MAG: metallophosphoesterase, partial [Roseovarius sp.]|nr:metallophosphoesterase [Roseovarius sp.]
MNRRAQVAPPPAAGADVSQRFHLRLLATSDVHGAILPFDYASGRDIAAYGLARTASLIARARHEARGGCLLVDNGDFLQGTPLSDLHDIAGEDGRHPVIAAMNRLQYDAATLGNHEFNFGLPALRAALEQAAFPVICANALVRRGARVAEDVTLLPPSVLIERELSDRTGARHRLRIGLLGLLPPQIMAWDRFHLARELCARDMMETAAARVPMLRAEGADLVVLLAHTGLETGAPGAEAENAALSLARLPGVDAIVAGHSHEVFPDPAAPVRGDGADHRAGTFWGVPDQFQVDHPQVRATKARHHRRHPAEGAGAVVDTVASLRRVGVGKDLVAVTSDDRVDTGQPRQAKRGVFGPGARWAGFQAGMGQQHHQVGPRRAQHRHP